MIEKTEDYHVPVMPRELLEYLQVAPGKKYIDATVGGGGHAAAIISRGGCVLGIDLDPAAVEFAKRRLAAKSKIVRGNFREIDVIARQNGFEAVDGILFDLGMSSWQIERSERGFSFLRNEPLDMRMDPEHQKVTAAHLVNALSKNELYELISQFGQEILAKKFATLIVRERRIKPIKTTQDLVAIIQKGSGGRRKRRLHPATKVFQALRIAVNDELNNLRMALPKAWKLLKMGGRLVVISFHSLEDRVVKEFGGQISDGKILTKKPLTPTLLEVKANPRARSAKLRSFEKL